MSAILREMLSTDNDYTKEYMTELYKYLVLKDLVMSYHLSTINYLVDGSEKSMNTRDKIIYSFECDEYGFIDELVGDYKSDLSAAMGDIDRGF
jgi:hypothetical protein